MILLFSGTGNSLHVANLLSAHLGDKIVRIPFEDDTLIENFDRIIWVFPVYSWGVPPVVRKRISRLNIPGAENVCHHAVMTCGDDIGLADKMWRNDLARRGWHSSCAFSVQMPNTYVLMKGFDVDKPEVAEKKIADAAPRVKMIAEKIAASAPKPCTDVVRGSFAWIKTKVICPWFVRFEMSPKPFHATDACTACGSCAAICPMHNIRMVDKRPQWGNNCALCLGCYHVCPAHAVEYGKATAGKGHKTILKK